MDTRNCVTVTIRSAKEYFIRSLQIDDGNTYALINLGVVLEKEGSYDQAIDMYQRVIETISAEAAKQPEAYSGRDMPLLETARQNMEHAKSQLK